MRGIFCGYGIAGYTWAFLPPNTFNQLQFKLLLHSLGWVPLELLCKAFRTTERKWEALGRRLKLTYALRGWWRKPSWRFHCTSSTFFWQTLGWIHYTFCHPWVFFEWVWNLSPNLCFLVVRMHIGTKLKKMCFHTSCVFLGVPNKMKQPMTFWAFVALFWKWSFFVSENFWQYKACITSYSLVLILN